MASLEPSSPHDVVIEDWAIFTREISKAALKGHPDEPAYVFRGHACKDWNLVPSISDPISLDTVLTNGGMGNWEGGRYLGIPENGTLSHLTSVQGTGCGTGRRTVAAYSRPGRDLLRHRGLVWLRDVRWPVDQLNLDGEQFSGNGAEGIDAVLMAVRPAHLPTSSTADRRGLLLCCWRS
jgi:hypothetical protein